MNISDEKKLTWISKEYIGDSERKTCLMLMDFDD